MPLVLSTPGRPPSPNSPLSAFSLLCYTYSSDTPTVKTRGLAAGKIRQEEAIVEQPIVVTGEKGRLGSALVERGCLPLGLRITSKTVENGALRSTLVAMAPRIIINAASYTRVDQAETEPARAYESNATAVALLRDTAASLPEPPSLIHISTDYVFYGDRGPYPECPQPSDFNPPSVYGRTKLAGEQEARRYLAGKVCVVRTTLLYDATSRNFVTAMVEQYRKGEPFPLYFADLRGNPTYIPYLADSIMTLVSRCFSHPEQHCPNTIHLAGEEVITRADLAWQVADAFGLDRTLLRPTAAAPPDFQGAPRAVYGGLGTAWARNASLSMPSLRAALSQLREAYGKAQDQRSTE